MGQSDKSRPPCSTVPGLTLVVGPANSGKLGRVLQWWQERQPARPVLVVPTVPDARALTRDLVERQGGLWGQSPPVTFDGLLSLLTRRYPVYPAAFEARLLIAHLLGELRLRCPAFTSSRAGLPASLASLLERLLDSGRTLAEVEGVLRRWGEVEPASHLLANDLCALLSSYHRWRANLGFADRSALAGEAGRAAQGWQRPVAFYGFTSFTPWQRNLVSALAAETEVLVALAYDPTCPVNLVRQAEYERWRAVATVVEEATAQTPAYSSPAIAHLQAGFLGEAAPFSCPAWVDDIQGVRFLLASGRQNEAELAALQVAGLLRRGFKPGDIAVVVRQLSPWRRLLADTLGSCGIPYQMDDRCLLRESGLGYAFLSALRGLTEDNPERFLAYLRSPYCGLEPALVADVERRFRRRLDKRLSALLGLVEGAAPEALWLVQQVLREEQGETVLDPEAAKQLARSMLVAGLRSTAAGSADMAADARAYRALLTALDSLTRLGQILVRGPGAVVDRHSGGAGSPVTDLAGTDLPGAHVTGTKHRSPGAALSFPAREVLTALESVPVRAGEVEDGEAVQVLSVHRARARRFPAMLVLGLVEGEFPGRADPPSLLSERQRRLLDALGDGLLPEEREEETALFLSAISRAWQVLMLSSRDAEDDGTAALPSPFWTRAREVLGVGDDGCLRRTLSDQVFPLAEAPGERHHQRARVAARGSGSACSGTDENSRRAGAAAGNGGRPGRLTSPAVLADLARVSALTPSAVEAYFVCPFKWFLERAVGVEEPEAQYDERLVGQLLHRVVAEVLRRLAAEGKLPLTESALPAAEAAAASVIEQILAADEFASDQAERLLLRARLSGLVRRCLRMEARAGCRLQLEGTEVEVGGRTGVDIGGLLLRGRVDRIDRLPDGNGYFVYDYKSGDIPRASDFGKAEGLQVPLYLLALSAERPGWFPLGGAYVSLKEEAYCGAVCAGWDGQVGDMVRELQVVDPSAMLALLEEARALALEAAEGMRAGLIPPVREGTCPNWCRLGSICRSERGGARW